MSRRLVGLRRSAPAGASSLAAFVIAGALLLGACSSSDEVSSDTTAPPNPSSSAPSTTGGPVEGRELSWEVSLTSNQRILRQVGPGADLNYGWNELVGPTTVDGTPAQVQMLGNVDYENGSGPFFGFVTLEFTPDDVLAFRMDGQATQAAGAQGTADSAFQAELTVIGGSGAYAGATGGRGTFTGSRTAQLGGQVSGTMTATVAGL